MARIKLAYIGGGSTRAPGVVAALVERAAAFAGSEIVLIDLEPDHLEIVCTLGTKLARRRGVDLRFSATTDRRAGLDSSDAVLSSYRPGGMEARRHDERVPLRHGIIGQETQGPGGFFMALRALHVMRAIVDDMQAVCPGALLLNYTNPVNIVAQAVSRHTPVPVISLCEGPITFPRELARFAGLNPDLTQAVMIGLNHACWSVQATCDGQPMLPLVAAAYERLRAEPQQHPLKLRLLRLAATMDSLPASYFQYYYYKDDVLRELTAARTTRAEDLLRELPAYWRHYREQADAYEPQLDRKQSRSGLFELELAIDVLDAVVNDRNTTWPVNVPNRGGTLTGRADSVSAPGSGSTPGAGPAEPTSTTARRAIPDFADDMVVEVPGRVGRHGATPLPHGPLPPQVAGLVKMLGEYQSLAADAAWHGTRREAVRALASNPLCYSLPLAEAVYDELAAVHKDWLPDRLLW
jgi:6-phospho-beta-glucosidase